MAFLGDTSVDAGRGSGSYTKAKPKTKDHLTKDALIATWPDPLASPKRALTTTYRDALDAKPGSLSCPCYMVFEAEPTDLFRALLKDRLSQQAA